MTDSILNVMGPLYLVLFGSGAVFAVSVLSYLILNGVNAYYYAKAEKRMHVMRGVFDDAKAEAWDSRSWEPVSYPPRGERVNRQLSDRESHVH